MSAWNADTVIGVDSSTSMIAKAKEVIENYISDNNVCALQPEPAIMSDVLLLSIVIMMGNSGFFQKAERH